MFRPFIAATLAIGFIASTALAAGKWTAEKTERGVTIKLDGDLFTEYLFNSGGKPAFWPLMGPNGKPITRAFPIVADVPGEERDHLHHRSFWFAFGSVNGINFWIEKGDHGTIKHRDVVEASGGDIATLVTHSNWLSPSGERQCVDERRYVFSAEADRRIIDVKFRILADPGEVKFGDSKEGALAFRVASTIRTDAKLGGQLINSAGDTDAAAFGKRAEWCDFHGPVDNETVGIAMLVHPRSFRAPNRWFARPYGLLAMNPFGDKDLSGSGDGSYTLPASESLTIRCRVILHKGDQREAKIAEAYEAYTQEQ